MSDSCRWDQIFKLLDNNNLAREDVLTILRLFHHLGADAISSSDDAKRFGGKMSSLELVEWCESPGEYQKMDTTVEKAWKHIRVLDRYITVICRTRE